ncbi:MAG: diguanylate cyclase [Alphaproteobacteria bacterium]
MGLIPPPDKLTSASDVVPALADGTFNHPRRPVIIFDDRMKPARMNQLAAQLEELCSLVSLLKPKLMSCLAGGDPYWRLELELNGQKLAFEWHQVDLEGGVSLVLGRNISDQQVMLHALADSRTRLRSMMNLATDLAWETDTQGRFVFASADGFLGYTAKQLVGQHSGSLLSASFGDISTLTAGTDTDRNVPGLNPFMTERLISGVELWLSARDGAERLIRIRAEPVIDRKGTVHGARGIADDITDEHRRHSRTKRSAHVEGLASFILKPLDDPSQGAAGLDLVVRSIANSLSVRGVAIYRQNDEGKLELAVDHGTSLSERIETLLEGIEPEQEITEIVAKDTRLWVIGTFRQNDPNGKICVWRSAEEPLLSDDDEALLSTLAREAGITFSHHDYQRELRRLSQTDGLTGLYNRRAFNQLVARRIGRSREETSAMMYLDLDNFKLLNDNFGHQAGDRALVQIGKIIRNAIRADDVPGRIGGDEFVIWLADTDAEGAKVVANRLLEAVSKLAAGMPRLERPLAVSIGMALSEEREGLEGFMARADEALYISKDKGKGCFTIHPGREASK